jgi:hypothetical protein
MPVEWKHKQAQESVARFARDLQRQLPELATVFPRPLDEIIETLYPVTIVEIPDLTFRKVIGYLDQVGIDHDMQVSAADDEKLAGFVSAKSGHGIIFAENVGDPGFILFTKAHELGHFLEEYWNRYVGLSSTPSLFAEGAEPDAPTYARRDPPGNILAYSPANLNLADSSLEELASLRDERRLKRKDWLREVRANLFAAELLMPVDLIEDVLRAQPDEAALIRLMKSRFGVSTAAARTRLNDLGVKLIEQNPHGGNLITKPSDL